MAMADYRLCDVCGGKAFYDVNLNYEGGEKQSDGSWKYPDHPFRVAGEAQAFGLSLDRMGDWAVLCNECAKTHKAVIVPLGTSDQQAAVDGLRELQRESEDMGLYDQQGDVP